MADNRILFSRDQIAQRVGELGAQITSDYATSKMGSDPKMDCHPVSSTGQAILAMTCEARQDSTGQVDLTLLIILKSAAMFGADLARAIDLPVRIEYITVSSYGAGTTSSGNVSIDLAELEALTPYITGKSVIIVEDIIDTTATLCALVPKIEKLLPKSLVIAALFNKDTKENRTGNRQAEASITSLAKYIGFEAPDEFIVGYGMDYNQQYRNLPDVVSLKQLQA